MRSMPGNAVDGHALTEALEQAAILCDSTPEVAVVDRGYKRVAVDGTKIYRPSLRRGFTRGQTENTTGTGSKARAAMRCTRRCAAPAATSDDPEEAAASLCLHSGCRALPRYHRRLPSSQPRRLSEMIPCGLISITR